MVLRKHFRKERNKKRQKALTRIKQLDDLEDIRCLEEAETKECKCWNDNVEEEDRKLEMDWRERSRQLWLQQGEANSRFFHMSANGQKATKPYSINNGWGSRTRWARSNGSSFIKAFPCILQEREKKSVEMFWQWVLTPE